MLTLLTIHFYDLQIQICTTMESSLCVSVCVLKRDKDYV